MQLPSFTVAGAVLVVALATYGCDWSDRPSANTPSQEEPAASSAQPPGDAAPASREEVRVADIVEEPNRYVGQTVSVVADVEEVHTPLSFTLDEDAPLEGGVDRDLLVLSPKSASLADIDDQWLNNEVRVTGKVGKMAVVEVEREIGWDLNPEIEAELERAGAVMIATSIERLGTTGNDRQ